MCLSLTDRSYSGAHKQKKARLAEDLSEKIQSQPGPLEVLQRHILPLENSESLKITENDASQSQHKLKLNILYT